MRPTHEQLESRLPLSCTTAWGVEMPHYTIYMDRDFPDDTTVLIGQHEDGTAWVEQDGIRESVLSCYRSIYIKLGSGNDTISITGEIPHPITLFPGPGDDTIHISGVKTNRLKINAGLGDDEIRIVDSIFSHQLDIVDDYHTDHIRLMQLETDQLEVTGGASILSINVNSHHAIYVGAHDYTQLYGFLGGHYNQLHITPGEGYDAVRMYDTTGTVLVNTNSEDAVNVSTGTYT